MIVLAVASSPATSLGQLTGRVSLHNDNATATVALPDKFNQNDPATEGQGQEEAGCWDC
jgi:hypothetical protein